MFMEQKIVSKEHMDFFEDTTKAAIAERKNDDSVSITVNNANEPPRGETNNVVFGQARHKPACTVTEAG